MGKIAFLFPGQGSQEVGMGKEFFEQEQSARSIFEEADQTLGFSLSKLCFEGPEDQLRLTTNTQPALFTTSAAILAVLKERINLVPDYVAGHSLGEYTAFYAAGAFSFSVGVDLVRKRGQFMEEAVPAGIGAMSAVLGMEREALREICENVTSEGNVVELANLNCPGQIVISGSKEGVEKAGEAAKAQGAKRVIPLSVSGPFHSSLMSPAAEKLKKVIEAQDELHDPQIPVIVNITARPVNTKEEMVDSLIKQVASPVLWEDSIRTLLQEGTDIFVEIGSGTVLSGLVKKVDRNVKTYSINSLSALHTFIEEMKGGER